MLWFIYLVFVVGVYAQTENATAQQAINTIFSTPGSTGTGNNEDEFPGYEEVTTPGQGGLGALEKCGRGSDQGIHLCVQYYMCDGVTKTIIQDGSTDGFGVIDIRFGANACDHPLETCCKIPEGGLPPTPAPTSPTPPTPTQGTSPPTITSPTKRPQNDNTIGTCGIRNNNGIDFKITGNSNNEAEYGEFPWMVAILKKNYNPSVDPSLAICGGSLISPRVVLTGAHCVYKYKTQDIKIRAGEWDTQTEKERLPYQERDVANIVVHKDFNQNTVANDVALVVLSQPVDAAEHIGTVCLPQQNERINSKNCFATGWGKDVFGKEGKFQVILKKIELPMVQHPQCQTALRTTRLGQHFKLHNSFICAGGIGGKDTCTGDGGSPLVCPDPRDPRRYIQAGIVAWGIGCGEENIPGVYADVSKFRSWVDEQIRNLNFETSSYE